MPGPSPASSVLPVPPPQEARVRIRRPGEVDGAPERVQDAAVDRAPPFLAEPGVQLARDRSPGSSTEVIPSPSNPAPWDGPIPGQRCRSRSAVRSSMAVPPVERVEDGELGVVHATAGGLVLEAGRRGRVGGDPGDGVLERHPAVGRVERQVPVADRTDGRVREVVVGDRQGLERRERRRRSPTRGSSRRRRGGPGPGSTRGPARGPAPRGPRRGRPDKGEVAVNGGHVLEDEARVGPMRRRTRPSRRAPRRGRAGRRTPRG